MIAPQTRALIDSLASLAMATAARLFALLREERELLSTRALDPWRDLLEEKTRTLTDLNQQGVQLQNALEENLPGLTSRERNTRLRGSGELALATQLEGLAALTARCGRANAVNGKLVQRLARHTERALDILAGKPPMQGGLYGPQGQTTPLQSTRYMAQV